MKLNIYIQNINVFIFKNNLFLVTPFGANKIYLPPFLDTKLVVLKNSIELNNDNCSLNSEQAKLKLYNCINDKIMELNNVTNKKLVLFGIGYRSWTCKTENNLSYIILKIGFSRDIVVKVPKTIKIISLKPTLILLKSINKIILSQFVHFLYSLKTPDVYKGKGIRFLNEKIVIKLGKNN